MFKLPEIKIIEFENRTDPDEVAHDKSTHLDPDFAL